MSKRLRRQKRALAKAARQQGKSNKLSVKAQRRAARLVLAKAAQERQAGELRLITEEMRKMDLANESAELVDGDDAPPPKAPALDTPPPSGIDNFYFGRWDRRTIEGSGVPPCSVHPNKENSRDVFVIHAHGPTEKALVFCSDCQMDLAIRLIRDMLVYPGLRSILGRVTLPPGTIAQLKTFSERLSALGALEAEPSTTVLTANAVEPPVMD